MKILSDKWKLAGRGFLKMILKYSAKFIAI